MKGLKDTLEIVLDVNKDETRYEWKVDGYLQGAVEITENGEKHNGSRTLSYSGTVPIFWSSFYSSGAGINSLQRI